MGQVAVCFLLPHFGHAFTFLNLDELVQPWLGRKCYNSVIGYQRGGCGSGRGFCLFAEEILTSLRHMWESVLSTRNIAVGEIHHGACPRTACDPAGQTDMGQWVHA